MEVGGDLVPLMVGEDGVEVTPSPSADGSPGYPDGGGLLPMPHLMLQLFLIMVILTEQDTSRLMVTQDMEQDTRALLLQGHHPLRTND